MNTTKGYFADFLFLFKVSVAQFISSMLGFIMTSQFWTLDDMCRASPCNQASNVCKLDVASLF